MPVSLLGGRGTQRRPDGKGGKSHTRSKGYSVWEDVRSDRRFRRNRSGEKEIWQPPWTDGRTTRKPGLNGLSGVFQFAITGIVRPPYRARRALRKKDAEKRRTLGETISPEKKKCG